MEDSELRQQFQSVQQQFQSVQHQFDLMQQQFRSLYGLVEGVKESLEREVTDVRDRVDRMSGRLDKIAAGAHYVTRLVEWSETQDKFQADILQRLQKLESRVDKLQGNGR